MNRLVRRLAGPAAVAALAMLVPASDAAGISVDAGITPPEDRWIFRSLARSMPRGDDPTGMGRSVDMLVWNNVLAYGLRPQLTLILKQPVRHREVSSGGVTVRDTGLGDLDLLAKYRLVRRNTRTTTVALASTLQATAPTGASEFSSGAWDVEPGLYGPLRRGKWASDFSVTYKPAEFAGARDGGRSIGDRLALDWAGARQFLIGGSADTTIAPVLEVSYRDAAADRLGGLPDVNSGEEVLFVSPGLKFTRSSLILEALVQVPVHQDQGGVQLERETGYLIGVRKLF